MAASVNLTPEERVERARAAGRAAQGPDAHIRALAKATLTPRQVAELRKVVQWYDPPE